MVKRKPLCEVIYDYLAWENEEDEERESILLPSRALAMWDLHKVPFHPSPSFRYLGIRSPPVQARKNYLVELNRLLSLKEGWGENGDEKPILPSTVDKVAGMLVLIETRAMEFEDPVIFPSDDGAIELVWEEPTFQLVVIIPEQDEDALYYADNYKGRKIKGKLPVDVIHHIYHTCVKIFHGTPR